MLSLNFYGILILFVAHANAAASEGVQKNPELRSLIISMAFVQNHIYFQNKEKIVLNFCDHVDIFSSAEGFYIEFLKIA